MNQSTKTRGFSRVVLPLPLAPITAITLLTRSPVGLVAIQSLATTFSPTLVDTSVCCRNDWKLEKV